MRDYVMITSTELRKRLQYDPETGLWAWLKSPRGGWEGKPAGSIDAKGYRCIKIDGQSYKASRLAYLYMTGEWPSEEMDHINRDQQDDRWENLREADRSLNNHNRDWGEMRGILRYHNKWKLEIDKMYLGLYENVEDAKAIRDLALWYKAGRFANLQGVIR